MFYITSMSGLIDGLNATLLATSGPGVVTNSNPGNTYVQYDDVLNMNTGVPYSDEYGLGFALSNGATGNLYYYLGEYTYAQFGGNIPRVNEQVSVNIVATPEPGTLVLLSTGLLFALCIITFCPKQIAENVLHNQTKLLIPLGRN